VTVVPYRTYPGSHPSRGAYFTRGTTKDAYARLLRDRTRITCTTCNGCCKSSRLQSVWCRSRSCARGAHKARFGGDLLRLNLAADGRGHRESGGPGARTWTPCAYARFPSTPRSKSSFLATKRLFVVEQNRDAQLRTLLVNELELDPSRLVPVLHYDGTPHHRSIHCCRHR